MVGGFGKRLIWGLGACLAVGSIVSRPALAATPEEVDAAIQKGVKYLYSQQKGDSWDPAAPEAGHAGAQWGGLSAIATYALLAAGEKPQGNPKLSGAIEWLKKQKITGTYAVGLRSQVWNLIPQDDTVRDAIKRDAQTLLTGGAKDANMKSFDGMWHYTPDAKSYDHSCSQYGTLGMWALERAGLEVSDALWDATEDQWKKDQLRDGSWGYSGDKPPNNKGQALNMTAAGIATLFITQDYLRSNDGIKCAGNVKNTAIDKGMGWMEKNLPELISKGLVQPYGMYGIERIGVASGYKYFGTIDWYKEGSDRVVKTQKGDNWGGIPNTAFCILFLARGRAPVVMNKLEYAIDGKEANWNQRPRDAANVVKYMTRQMERDLNWQIVNLGVSVDDLHDAPILYIAGNQALKFSQAEEAKLKQFVEQGGMILGHADCADQKFVASFKALGTKLFKYEFKAIEKDHPIYTRQQFLFKNWKNKPALEGMSNGVRELMLLIPSGDPAKAWQLADDRSKEEQFQLLANIFLYAVEGRDLRFKGSTYLVAPDTKKTPTRTAKIGRLEYAGNWNPEPGGWTRLGAVMHNTVSAKIETVPVKAEPAALKDLKAVHITGTEKINLNPAQQTALKDFVNNGGTLLIDAAGGSGEFAASIEAMLGQMFPAEAGQLHDILPVDHPLYSVTGAKLGDVTYRPFARGKVPSGQRTPLLRGMKIGDRQAVIYSREDLSGGLVGESIDGILGYSVASATDLMRNMVMFANKLGPAPVAPASTKPPGTKPAAAPPAKQAGATTKPAVAATKPATTPAK